MPKSVILLAVAGKNPVVVLEAIYALHYKGITVDEVHCITTEECEASLLNTLYDSRKTSKIRSFYLNNGLSYSRRIFFENNDYENPYLTIVHKKTDPPARDSRLSEGDKDAEVVLIPVQDIRSPEDDEAFLQTCLREAENISESSDVPIYYLISGGRKTMASSLTIAAQWFAGSEDRICHVLVDPPEKTEQCNVQYLLDMKTLSNPQIVLNLITTPVPVVREFLPETPEEIRVLATSLINKEDLRLVIDISRKKISYLGIDLSFAEQRLGPKELAMYCFYAKHPGKKFSREDFTDSESQVMQEIVELHKQIPKDTRGVKPITFSEQSFRSCLSHINSAIRNNWNEAREELLIQNEKSSQGSKYGIMMDTESIDFLPCKNMVATEKPGDTVSSPYKTIILAVTGQSPQVITEALYALNKEDIAIVEVHCITTGEGNHYLESYGFFSQDKKTPISGLCEEYSIDPPVLLSENTVHILKRDDDTVIQDILSQEDSNLTLKKCLELAEKFTSDDQTRVFFLISGGRKSMSASLAVAAQMYGRGHDRMFHVLINDPIIEKAVNFWYPTSRSRELLMNNGDTFHRDISAKRLAVNLVPLQFPRLARLLQERPAHEQIFDSLMEDPVITVNLYLESIIDSSSANKSNPGIELFFSKGYTIPITISPKYQALYAYLLYLRHKNINEGCLYSAYETIESVDEKIKQFNIFSRIFQTGEEEIEKYEDRPPNEGLKEKLNDWQSLLGNRTRLNKQLFALLGHLTTTKILHIENKKLTTLEATKYFIPIPPIQIRIYPSSFELEKVEL